MFSLGWIDAAILCVILQHLEELRGRERLIFLDPDVGYGSWLCQNALAEA
jgi:hypothetical protein